MSARTLRARVCQLALSFLLAGAAAGSAVIFNVNTVEDDIDFNTVDIDCETAPDNGICTLRAAVMQANVMPSDSTIVLPAGTYYLERIPTGGNGDDTGDLNLTNATRVITIIGASAATTIIDGNQLDRVFNVETGRTAIISGVTVRNGQVNSAPGGGIFNAGSLTVSYCTLSGNHAVSAGGGIMNDGMLTLSHSTLRDNTTIGGGGGIYSAGSKLDVDQCTLSGNASGSAGGGIYIGSGTVDVNRSTISSNEAGDEGGGVTNFGTLFATNSTISDNSSTSDGGGIYNGGTAWTYNATIAFNEADEDDNQSGSGGGVYNSGSFYPRSSVIMGNTNLGSPDLDDCFGTLKLWGQNAFSIFNGACTFEPQNADAAYFVRSVNGLGPLQFNGGSTRTHALAAGSGLIDGGASTDDCLGVNPPVPLTSDQRGGAKEVGTLCDLGAFEFGALPAGLIFADSFELGNLWAWV